MENYEPLTKEQINILLKCYYLKKYTRVTETENNLSKVFDEYIADGLISEDKRYWERIKKAGDIPTAAELLDFIYDKFEIDIEGGI